MLQMGNSELLNQTLAAQSFLEPQTLNFFKFNLIFACCNNAVFMVWSGNGTKISFGQGLERDDGSVATNTAEICCEINSKNTLFVILKMFPY